MIKMDERKFTVVRVQDVQEAKEYERIKSPSTDLALQYPWTTERNSRITRAPHGHTR